MNFTKIPTVPKMPMALKNFIFDGLSFIWFIMTSRGEKYAIYKYYQINLYMSNILQLNNHKNLKTAEKCLTDGQMCVSIPAN